MRELLHLDWQECLRLIQDSATSGLAKIEIGNMQAFSDQSEAESSISKIQDAIQMIQSEARPFMESLDLFEPWYTRVKRRAVLKALEFRDVRSFCLEIVSLKEIASKIQNDWCQQLRESLMKADEPLSAIDQILSPRGEIRSDASETLYRLFKEKEAATRQLQSTLDRLVKDHDMESVLQDKYVTTREGRWVLPIRSGMQHRLPGVIHGSSQTKQTVFMEPELVVPINNRLRQIEVEIEDEIERLLTQLSNYLADFAQDFFRSKEILLEADSTLAKAQWSIQIQAKPVNFGSEEILLTDVRHPLLVLSGKPVISNTVHLTTSKSVLLLSGPNAGGKTVLLKSIGLAAQMARCGLLICAAENSYIPFFKNVTVAIGDSQSVGAELSTFAAHLKILDEAAKLKGPSSLVLIDEICGATDPEEGAALARSFIEEYSSKEVFAVITSHLSPLKSGWSENSRVLNGSLEYNAQTGRPTYQFLQGIPGDSLALQTARRVGVSKAIVDRAVESLTPEARARVSRLDELDKLKSDIQFLQTELKKQTSKAVAEEQKYKTLSAKLESEKESILAKIQKTAEKKIEEMLQQAKVEQTFKKHSALQEIKHQLPEIVKAKVAPTGNPETVEDFAKRFPVGSKVYLAGLQQDAIVQSSPNGKGEVQVLSNSLRLTLPWQELRPPQKSQNPTADIIRRSSSVSIALVDNEKVVDVRGMTVEQAIGELEITLDRSATDREDRIKIIHGHGTEALKKAVRAYLSRSVYVKKWKAGSPEQGGDGVTWAELGET